MTRRAGRARLGGAAALLCGAAAAMTAWSTPAAAAEAIAVRTAPISAPGRLFADAAATFVGGLVLRAADDRFGGISGAALDGADLSLVTDRGHWLRFRVDRGPRGEITALSDGRIGPLLDRDGAPLRWRNIDAEAVGRGPGGGWWIGFEQRHRITRRPALDAAADATAAQLPSGDFERNGGIEALAADADGGLWAFAETPSADGASILGWRLHGGRATAMSISRSDGFKATGADFGPDGALYLLERRYGLLSGVRMRVRRFGPVAIAAVWGGAPGESTDLGAGETLLTLDQRAPIDNMEALVVEAAPATARPGAPPPRPQVLITALSDDNFALLQRTVLLQFTAPAATSPTHENR